MEIVWYGLGCFRIQSKNVIIYINPMERKFRFSSLKDSIVISTNPGEKEVLETSFKKNIFLITQPGEYEIKDVFIYGIPFHSQGNYFIIYKLEIEDLSIAYLGKLNNGLFDEIIEELDGLDILIVPIGGGNVLDKERAANLVNQINPKIVVPIYFKSSGKEEDSSLINRFCKDIGGQMEKVDKLRIKKKNLIFEKTKVYILESH